MTNVVTKATKKHKWALDLSTKQKNEIITAPNGFLDKALQDTGAKDSNQGLVAKKSWDVALGPLKQIPMNLFIMWMAGNTISIFPIMMVGMMFVRPIQAFLNVQQTFKMIEGSNAILQKFVYLLGNGAGVLLAVYKCQTMGLLPTHASDWLAFVEPQTRQEWSSGGVLL